MALKINNQAFEFSSIPRAISAKDLYGELIKDNPNSELLKEILEFSERNLTIHYTKKEIIYDCCPSCLKAHIIKRAEHLGLERSFLKKIKKIKPGHNGYYLDKGKLIKLSSDFFS